MSAAIAQDRKHQNGSAVPPKGCTFSPTDWQAIAPFWYPVAFSHEVNDRPVAATLLDQRLVIWRTAAGLSAANDICLHRGVPLSMGHLKDDQIICKYHGFHYDASGQCSLIPANPQASIPSQLCLKTYPVKEAYGLVWTTLAGSANDEDALPFFPEWTDADYQQIVPDGISLECRCWQADGRLFRRGSFRLDSCRIFWRSQQPHCPPVRR